MDVLSDTQSMLSHTHTTIFAALFPGLPGVSQCQMKKSSSVLYGAREDKRGRHTDNLAGHHSIRTIHLHHPPFLHQIPFLPKPSQFILAWCRHQICWLAYPVAWLTLSMDWKSQITDCNHDNHPRLTLKITVSDSNRSFIYDSIFAVNCLNLQVSVFAIMMHRVSLHIERCHMINMAANK